MGVIFNPFTGGLIATPPPAEGGGGGNSVLFPADGSVVTGDVGKLLMNDGSETAKVFALEPEIPSSDYTFTLTRGAPSASGTPSTPSTQASGRWDFAGQPAEDDQVSFTLDTSIDPTNATFTALFKNAPGAYAGGTTIEVQIEGMGLTATLNALHNAWTTIFSNPSYTYVQDLVTGSQGVSSYTLTAGGAAPVSGAEANGKIMMAESGVNITTALLGGMGEFINGVTGTPFVPGTVYTITDELFNMIAPAISIRCLSPAAPYMSGDIIEYSPGVDAISDAQNIETAFNSFLVGNPGEIEDSYDVSRLGAVVTLTRNEMFTAYPLYPALSSQNLGLGSSVDEDEGVIGSSAVSSAQVLGEMLSLSGPNVEISTLTVCSVILEEELVAGSEVSASDEGKVRAKVGADRRFGFLLQGGVADDTVFCTRSET
jgi:hypothetical protein